MRSSKVRNHVSDSVEKGIDTLHRVADRCLVYPLAAVEGALQGAARGVHNVVAHKHNSDRVNGASHHSKYCNCKTKPHGSSTCAYGHPVGSSPYEFYSCVPNSTHGHLPFAPAAPPPQFQYHYQPAFPVPCRPPH